MHMMVYHVLKVTDSVILGTCLLCSISFYRETKIVHLTLSQYASIIATKGENMTIPPQFGVG